MKKGPHTYARILDAAYGGAEAALAPEPRHRRKLVHDRRHLVAQLDQEPAASQRQAAADGPLRAQPVQRAPPAPEPAAARARLRGLLGPRPARPLGRPLPRPPARQEAASSSSCPSCSGRRTTRTTSSTSGSRGARPRAGSPTRCGSPGAGRASTPSAGSRSTTTRRTGAGDEVNRGLLTYRGKKKPAYRAYKRG